MKTKKGKYFWTLMDLTMNRPRESLWEEQNYKENPQIESENILLNLVGLQI
jgi:hypothetical protein